MPWISDFYMKKITYNSRKKVYDKWSQKVIEGGGGVDKELSRVYVH